MNKGPLQKDSNKLKTHHYVAPSFGFAGVVALCALNGLTWLGCGIGGLISAGVCYAGVVVVDKLALLVDTLISTLNESKAVAVNINEKLSGLDSTLKKVNTILQNIEDAKIIENVGQRVAQLEELEDHLEEIVRHIQGESIPSVDLTLAHLAEASGQVNEKVLPNVVGIVSHIQDETIPSVDQTLEHLGAASAKVNEEVLLDVAEAVRRVRQASMIFGGGQQQNYQPEQDAREEHAQPERGRGRGRGRGH